MGEILKRRKDIEMKEFTNLTELEVLNLAYDSLLARWLKERERLENDRNTLTETRFYIIDTKLTELRVRILELENA